MTGIWQKMDLSGETPAPDGGPASLPQNVRRLTRETLADLSFLVASNPSFENVGYWPVTAPPVTPALGHQTAATFTREVDAEAKSVTVTYDTEPKALSTRKAEMKVAITERRWTAETGGITVSSVAVATDAATQAKLSGALQLVQDDDTVVIDWKTAAGTWVQINAAAVTAIARAVGLHVQACFSREKALHGAVDDAADHDDLDLIDIQAGSIDSSGGWP